VVPSTTKQQEESAMAREMTTGAILIKDGALLPEGLLLETQPCVPGWKAVQDFDAYGLDREIQKSGWTFFSLAEVIRATVFGIDLRKMIQRAIERILANPKSEGFNSLEITQITSLGSGKFPGVRFITVSAISRHIQKGLTLFCINDVPEPVTTRIASGPKPALAVGSERSPERGSKQSEVGTT
jgi:hypothetical protein